MSVTCYIGIGSNMAPRLRRLDMALTALGEIVDIEDASAAVESDDHTGRGPAYLNMAVRCTTEMSLDELQATLRDLERRLGRKPDSKERGQMPVDIDIVEYDGTVVSHDDFERQYFTTCYRQLNSRINNLI